MAQDAAKPKDTRPYYQRAGKHQVNLTLSAEELALLRRAAATDSRQLTPFIRLAALARAKEILKKSSEPAE